jgi:tetratricopeptide (TPR) repeat protein
MREFAWRAMETHPELLVASGSCNAFAGVGDPYLPFREVLAMLTGDVESRWAAGAISREGAQRLWAAVPLTAPAVVQHGPYLIEALLSGPAVLARAMAIAPGDAEWLRELAGWVQRDRASHSDLEQRAIFEQYSNVLCNLSKKQPLLLILDDLQWADKGSIGMLFHLSRRVRGERILIVGAYRPEEVALPRDGEQHPLQKVVAEAQRRFGDVGLDLTEVDQVEAYRFVEALLDTEPNRLSADFREGLSRRTGGHPLFTIELLRTMQERGDLQQDADCAWVEGAALDWKTLPARVEAVIKARVDRMDGELRDLLAVASVEGETFTAQVVAQLQGLSEREVLHALSGDLGSRHRIVREAGEVQIGRRYLSRYQFSHALFQAYLYDALGPGERRLLHGEVGEALERLYGEQAEELAVQLAHHFGEAGRPEKAAAYALRAGDQARLAYANDEAIAYYQQILELLDTPALAESRQQLRLAALRGLGQAYLVLGQDVQAERYLRMAVSIARELGYAPSDVVRILFWLGETLWWQDRFDDLIEIAEEGLALLEDEAVATGAKDSAQPTPSVELALMLGHLAIAYDEQGNNVKFRHYVDRIAQFLTRLPYTEELRPSYVFTFSRHLSAGRPGEALKWIHALEEHASAYRDLRALAAAPFVTARCLREQGDWRGSAMLLKTALEQFVKIGDVKHKSWCLQYLAQAYLVLGKLDEADEVASEAVDAATDVGRKESVGNAYTVAGRISFAQNALESAVQAFEDAIEIYKDCSYRPHDVRATILLGRVCLALGNPRQATHCFEKAVSVAGPEILRNDTDLFAAALGGLEEVLDGPDGFLRVCLRLREQYPDLGDSALADWYLKPSKPHVFANCLVHDALANSLAAEWSWQDPFGDCSFDLRNGLEIHAANGRDLWRINLSAPRLLRPAPEEGIWTVETVCVPVSEEAPAIGGLLLWRDKRNYLRLDRGTRGAHEISFAGCLGNRDVIFGRGCLTPGASDEIILRLEQVRGRVKALCSADGVEWFSVGEVAFPAESPLQIGLHAIGDIDRTIYRGAYPHGTAIHFESFTLWGMNG